MRLSHPTQVIMKPLYAYNFGCGSTGSGMCFFAPQREEEESSRLFYVAMTRAEQRLILSFTAAGRKPQNWDKLVMERLGIEPGAPGDAVETYDAPDGKQWKARILIAQAAPDLVPESVAVRGFEA